MTDGHQPTAAGPTAHPYDERYFQQYHSAEGPVPYDRSRPAWIEFFGRMADCIVADLKPRRVLDVGCAKGFLVEALRDRGVEAFGLDLSEYAIGQVRPDIRRFCWVASAAESIAGHYDLITCIEVLEHLTEDDARRAVVHIAEAASDVLFSSSPDDFDEPTHLTVRPREWWIQRFGEAGLAVDPACDARFIARHAVRFRRAGGRASTVDTLLDHRYQLWDRLTEQDAETTRLRRRRDRLESDLAATRRGADALRNELLTIRPMIDLLQSSIRDKDTVIAGLTALRGRLQADVCALERGLSDKDTVIAGLTALRDRLQADAQALRLGLTQKDAAIADLVASMQATGNQLRADIDHLRHVVDDKDNLIAGLSYHLIALQRTIGWKLLGRVRRIRDFFFPVDSRRRQLYWRMRRPLEVYLDEGARAFMWKAWHKLRLRYKGYEPLVKAPPADRPSEDNGHGYNLWMLRTQASGNGAAHLQADASQLAYKPVISVVMPVYNTDERWLRRAIDSVRAQIYPHWELCLANDGSNEPHVRPILDEYVATDARIWVKHLSRNRGIAGASNDAIQMASGDFVALVDHDDELPPEALLEVARTLNAQPDVDLIYTDEDKLETDGRRVEPFFKPGWSPDLLLSMNYITHLSVFRRSVLNEIGGFRMGLDGSQDYDLLLRFTERTTRIAHIPKILYHWRKIPSSAASSSAAKPYAYEAARQAVEDAVRRRGRQARVDVYLPGLYNVRYAVADQPTVSIIIPTRDRWPLLQQCLRSIQERTRYPRYEIVVMDNDSVEPETRRGLDALARKSRVLHGPGAFNFSALNNQGAREARGAYLLFLNNDTQVIDADWLSAMLEHAQRPEVGAVGARLHYPDGRIQHAGLVLGIGGVADHAFKGLPADAFTYFALGNVVRNVSAVTAACMMVRREVFEEVHGFDEELPVALNDVDLCLRLRQRGYLIVYTPHALLYHHESGTRGRLHPPSDEERVWRIWGTLIRKGDPYYNPNLTLSRTDWSLADRP